MCNKENVYPAALRLLRFNLWPVLFPLHVIVTKINYARLSNDRIGLGKKVFLLLTVHLHNAHRTFAVSIRGRVTVAIFDINLPIKFKIIGRKALPDDGVRVLAPRLAREHVFNPTLASFLGQHTNIAYTDKNNASIFAGKEKRRKHMVPGQSASRIKEHQMTTNQQMRHIATLLESEIKGKSRGLGLPMSFSFEILLQ